MSAPSETASGATALEGRRRCPSCGSTAVTEFFSQSEVPGTNCLLFESRDAALSYPRGAIELCFCDQCGFIFNAAFDPHLIEYSENYEETQTWSPTFRRWMRSLAERLAKTFDLRGKTVLEIGCGKGEFLIELCEIAGCEGIGVDPSYVPERQATPEASRVRFIRDFYGPRYAHLRADLVCCRHTLEHIADVDGFVRGLRAAIGDELETTVLFEVPDVHRILTEGAFWDVYYEHCSYFSAGSQARLFRRSGFDVFEIACEYGKQYLLQLARPARDRTVPTLAEEEEMEELRAAVRAFPALVKSRIEEWRERISRAADRGQRVVVWGSGSKGVALLAAAGDAVEYVVDINPLRQGRFMPGSGQEIVAPEFLERYRPDLAIVANSIYRDEIQKTLHAMDLRPELVSL